MGEKIKKIVRTRYAPSPTGYLHIGGARTALFNYLFAKSKNGIFVVRIEDTDIERNVENGIDSQLNNLLWLKIFPDESIKNPGLHGPYIQSDKLSRYKELCFKLLDEGKAYRCFCTANELESSRNEKINNRQTPKYSKKCLSLTKDEIEKKISDNIPFTIRLKINDDQTISWNDLVRGEISFPTSALTDLVILKSNGYPTYNFAVVVDDYDMEISHVIRGEEHISNTPYQILISRALGFDDSNIQYGHLSVIIDETGKKLSKRNVQLKQFIEDYKNSGYPSEAIVNYLSLLGWCPELNNEIIDLNSMIKIFKLENVSFSPTTFDIKKMNWISSEYFKKMDDKSYLGFVTPFVKLNESYNNIKDYCLLMFKNQISYAYELNDLINDLLKVKRASKKQMQDLGLLEDIDSLKKHLENFVKILDEIDEWDENKIKDYLKNYQSQSVLKGKNFFMSLRYAITRKEHGPELYKVIYVLGKFVCQKNISSVIKLLAI